jgi:hypothetical protein
MPDTTGGAVVVGSCLMVEDVEAGAVDVVAVVEVGASPAGKEGFAAPRQAASKRRGISPSRIRIPGCSSSAA